MVAWSSLALGMALVTARWQAVYVEAGAEIPWITQEALAAGQALRVGRGLVPLVLGLTLFLLPLQVVPNSRYLRTHFALGAVEAGLFGALARLSLEVPLVGVESLAREDSSAVSLLRAAWVATTLATPVGAVCVAGVWGLLSWETHRLPRAHLVVEVLRAVLISALPTIVLAPVAYSAAASLPLRSTDWLITSPGAAAAGTLTLTLCLAALGFRLQHPTESG